MRGGPIGDDQIGSTIAMMVMPASSQITGLVLTIRCVFMMLGVCVMMIMHGVERETFRAAMFVRDHQGRCVPNLIGRFCRHRGGIDDHQQGAERGGQAVKKRRGTVRHVSACK